MQDAEDDEGLLLAIEQTIDALTFSQTHVVDTDFRAHSRSTIDSVVSLQEEQRNRVDGAFRAMPVTPQYVAAQLLSVYRGEAASISLARDHDGSGGVAWSEGGAVDEMSDSQCKSFKKELKQRIHEWEGAFRDANHREAAPQDKVMLRPIYELYKYAKNRVTKIESVATAAGGQPHTQARATVAVTPQRSSSIISSVSVATTAQPIAPTPDRFQGQSAAAAFSVSPAAQRPSTNATASAPSFAATPGGQPQSGGAGANTAPAVAAVTGASAPHITPTVTSGQEIPLEELIQEKRKIKRLLHQFEASFEQRYGRKPTRDDRREYTREYHRYGELKALLSEHSKPGDD